MAFNVELSGVSIEIHHRYEYIKYICNDYMTEKQATFSVRVTDTQIENEQKQTEGRFPKEICESTCIHREIVKGLVKYGIILMHSAVIAVDGIAYVFMAKSGIGKSTHIRLWREVFGQRCIIVNGDKPLFSFVGDKLMVHGSPWRGKEGFGVPISMPVGGICLLERGKINTIQRATNSEIIEKIFHQVLLPTNVTDNLIFMQLLNRIIKEVAFYKLKCNMDREAAIVAYEGMKN